MVTITGAAPSQLFQGTSPTLPSSRLLTAAWKRQRKLGHSVCFLPKFRHTEQDNQD